MPCLHGGNGNWGLDLAAFLYAAGVKISIVNPKQIKAFAESELSRNKTDKLDAALIARFCRAHAPPAWTPPAPEMRELREMVPPLRRPEGPSHTGNQPPKGRFDLPCRRHLDRTTADLYRTGTPYHHRSDPHVDRRHSALQNNFDLLCSIPSIGEVTAALVLAELPNIAEFTPKGPRRLRRPLSPGAQLGHATTHRQHQPHRQPRPAQHPLSLRSQRPAPQSAPRRFRATPDPGWKTSQGRPHRPRPQAAGHGTRRHPNPKTVRDGLITYPLTQTPP